MKSVSIDLGSGGPSDCCSDTPLKSEPSKYYPSVHYNGDEELNIPDEGEMTIRYKKTASGHNVDSTGKKHYNCTIEVREITGTESGEVSAPAKNLSSEAGDSLDRLRRERVKEMKEKY